MRKELMSDQRGTALVLELVLVAVVLAVAGFVGYKVHCQTDGNSYDGVR